jgi:hypothetical protein
MWERGEHSNVQSAVPHTKHQVRVPGTCWVECNAGIQCQRGASFCTVCHQAGDLAVRDIRCPDRSGRPPVQVAFIRRGRRTWSHHSPGAAVHGCQQVVTPYCGVLVFFWTCSLTHLSQFTGPSVQCVYRQHATIGTCVSNHLDSLWNQVVMPSIQSPI